MEIYLEWLYFTASHTTPRWDSKLEVSLIIPNELFCSRKHQADVSQTISWTIVFFFFFLNENMFYSLSFSTWQRKGIELFCLGNS